MRGRLGVTISKNPTLLSGFWTSSIVEALTVRGVTARLNIKKVKNVIARYVYVFEGAIVSSVG